MIGQGQNGEKTAKIDYQILLPFSNTNKQRVETKYPCFSD